MKMTRNVGWAVVLLAGLLTGRQALAHCQVPCGIYDDGARIKAIAEDITTIEKAMAQIKELSAQMPLNQNQIVRWVMTKDAQASHIQEVVADYFMTQRIKPTTRNQAAQKKYVTELTLLHQMLVAAMKCKQTVDPAHVTALRSLLHDFEHSYLGEH